MAAEIVNLRRVRKRRQRADAEARAETSRTLSSIPGRTRRAEAEMQRRADARHAGHALERPDDDQA